MARTVIRMPKHSFTFSTLITALALTISSCGSSTVTTPSTTVALPDGSTMTSDPAFTREDVYAALAQVPDLPLKVTTVSADGNDNTGTFWPDGGFESTTTRLKDAPGPWLAAVLVVDGLEEAGIVSTEVDGPVRWISWKEVAATWREAVSNVVPERYQNELKPMWYESSIKELVIVRTTNTFAALASSVPYDNQIECLADEATATQNTNGSWTLECESQAFLVTVWLDGSGRAARLDYEDAVFSTSSNAQWDGLPEDGQPTRDDANPRASKKDTDALRKIFENQAKELADLYASLDKSSAGNTNE